MIEFHRPWDYPDQCGPETGLYKNVGEVSDIRAELDHIGRDADLGGIKAAGVKPSAGTGPGAERPLRPRRRRSLRADPRSPHHLR